MTTDPEPAGLRERVRRAYSEVARAPAAEHAFPVGRRLARRAGYPEQWLQSVPPESVEAFAGLSCLPCFAAVPSGASVLDLGCGAGLDSLMVAGTGVSALGPGFSQGMLSAGRRSAEVMGVRTTRFQLGDAEGIPAATGSLDA